MAMLTGKYFCGAVEIEVSGAPKLWATATAVRADPGGQLR